MLYIRKTAATSTLTQNLLLRARDQCCTLLSSAVHASIQIFLLIVCNVWNRYVPSLTVQEIAYASLYETFYFVSLLLKTTLRSINSGKTT